MAKEKLSHVDREQKDLTFYYEVVGIISIIIPLIILARLGIVGHYAMVTFRLLFGDWYFTVVIAWFIYGLRCLIYHKPLNIRSMRFVGILLIAMGLLIISHFPMHNYVSQYTSSNYIGLTIDLYLDYFKNYYEGIIVGGGIFGCLLYYLFYFFFAKVGTVIITMILIFVGISFLFQKTTGEFLLVIGSFVKRLFLKSKRLFHLIKYDIKRSDASLSKSRPMNRSKTLSASELKGIKQENYPLLEEKNAKERQRIIQGVLNNLNIFYNNVSYYISNHITSFVIATYALYNADQLNMKLHQLISSPYLLKENDSKDQITIEIANLYPLLYDFKLAFANQNNYNNNALFPLGLASNGEIVIWDSGEQNSLLLIGPLDPLFKRTFNSLIIMNFYKYNNTQYQNIFVDCDHSLKEWERLSEYFEADTFEQFYQKTLNDIELRLEQMNQANVNSVAEYNQRQLGKPFLRCYIYLSALEHILNNNAKCEKLVCLIQLGIKAGYYFVATLTSDVIIPSIINSLFATKVILKNDFAISSRVIGQAIASMLTPGESFYAYKNQLIRFSNSILAPEDYENIKKRVK